MTVHYGDPNETDHRSAVLLEAPGVIVRKFER